MIWALGIVLVLAVLYTGAGNENRAQAARIKVTLNLQVDDSHTYRMLDSAYRSQAERARLQLQTGRVLFVIALLLAFVKVVMEIFA